MVLEEVLVNISVADFKTPSKSAIIQDIFSGAIHNILFFDRFLYLAELTALH